MPDTVTVSETQGARYTWASAGFTWSSASAGKNWTTAYPAVYNVAVAVTLAFVEATGRQWTKRSNETLAIAEKLAKQLILRESEAIGFGETYSDLIAYVLRWVETMTVDVPDIFDRGTAQITDPAAGASIYFSRSFRVAPEVTMTHKGGSAVAIPRLLGAVTTTGFTAVLENSSGSRVTGSFTWIAQGY